MIRRLYDWTLDLAAKPYAIWALAVVAFIESSFFPIPPDVLLIPMIIAARHKAWLYAMVATVASVAGGAFGYLIGYALYDTIGQPVLAFYGKEAYFAEFAERYNAMGPWAVLAAGITPFPFKVITIASGVTAMNFPAFLIAALAARALRFFIVAALLWKFGAPIRDFIEKRLGLMFALFCILLIGGFALLKLL